jgi:hypothetical protein
VKIKMQNLSAGPDGVMESGKVYDVNGATARRLIDGGYATAVATVKAPETVEPEVVEESAKVEPEEEVIKEAVEEVAAKDEAEIETATVKVPEKAVGRRQRRAKK